MKEMDRRDFIKNVAIGGVALGLGTVVFHKPLDSLADEKHDIGQSKHVKDKISSIKKDLRVALLQADLQWENKERNLQKFSQMISTIQQPVDLIVLPETFSTGFTVHVKQMAEKMDGKAVNWMKKIASQTHATITGSLIIEENGKCFNRLVWVPPDGDFSFYDKRHLFRMAKEHAYYSAGNTKLIVELNGWKICPLICYDLRFPVWSRNTENYDILLYVANWPSPRRKAWQILLQARAMENISYVIGVNRIGDDVYKFHYIGNSLVCDPNGEILSHVPEGEEKVELVTLSWDDLQQFREKCPFYMDADSFNLVK